MSFREADVATTPHSVPTTLTRRQIRELESAAAPAKAKKSIAKRGVTKRPMRGKLRPPRAKRSHPTTSAPRKLLSFGALMFAGALLVGMSVPANAFMPADLFTADAATLADETVASKVATQSVAVPQDATAAPVARDGYSVTSYAELLRAQYGSQGGTFTATTGAIRWPFPYTVPITDGFGWRPNGTSGTSHHNGVDFTPGGGTPIYAVADGIVTTHSDDAYGYGNHVIISHNVNGLVFDSLYAHMQTGTSPLNAGDSIKAGDFIGLVGDTGDSYGAHLHLEIRIGSVPVDPFAWLQANATN